MYVIFSPIATYGFPYSVAIVFSALIIGSTYVCVTSFVGVSFTFATFVIGSKSSISFTVTSNVTLDIDFAATVTLKPASNCSFEYVPAPSTFILPSTSVVPVGIVSCTFTVPGAVPLLLSNVIVYVIFCPCITSSPLAGSDDLLASIFGVYSGTSSAFVDVPSTTAVFLIILSYVSSGNSSAVTLNVNVSVLVFAMFTCIPDSNWSFVYVPCPFIFMLPSTNVVYCGIVSCIVMSFP